MDKLKPLLDGRVDFIIHGEEVDAVKAVADYVTKEQLEGLKNKAKAIRAKVN